MSGINAGVLYNAQPLSDAEIQVLEQEVLDNERSFVYLNEKKELCFALPRGVDQIKRLAWNFVHQLTTVDDNLIEKTTYEKTGIETYKSNGTEALVGTIEEEPNELGTTIII